MELLGTKQKLVKPNERMTRKSRFFRHSGHLSLEQDSEVTVLNCSIKAKTAVVAGSCPKTCNFLQHD